MRKLLGIVLLISLLVPACGTFLWLYVKKMQIRETVREQMIKGIPNEELVLLKLTAAESRSELRWEHSGEFEYRRQMYDVVSSETRGDTIYYFCWADDAETELNRQYERLVAETTAKDPKRSLPYQRLFDFFESLYCTKAPIGEGFRAETVRTYCHRIPNHSGLFYPPPAPPPRFV